MRFHLFSRLNFVILIGLFAIVGVLVMQLLMLTKAYDFEQKTYEDKIHFALQDIVRKIYRDNGTDLPITNQVKKISEDYYIVNVDDVFEASILNYYLNLEFEKVKLNLDFEYAIYDCVTDEMVFGNKNSGTYVNATPCDDCFETSNELIYYFGIRFPNLKFNILSSLRWYWMYTFVLVLVLIIYVYSIVLLLKQKRYSELQRDFINNMTHEFKTPLASILIASNYAQTQELIKKDAKLSKYIDIIIRQSEKLNQHIERILSVVKTESAQMQLEYNNINVKEMFTLVKENALLKYHQLDCDIEITVHDDVNLRGDAFHLYNVFFNLVDNSIKYSSPNPKVKVEIATNHQYHIVSISDNGPGIDIMHLNHIFDKFYRVPRPDNKEVEGFGIGLYYVKKIIRLHKWKIMMQNKASGGLEVRIQIPLKNG